MTSARRYYLYIVALVGLLVTLLGTLASIELGVRLVLLPEAATAGLFPRFAVAAGLAVGGLLLWLSHWLMANNVAGNMRMGSAIERQAPVRKAYFHLGRLAALLLAAWRIVILINDVLLIVLGSDPDSLPDWPARPLAAVLGAVVSLLIWSYLRNSAHLDADFGHEVGGGAVWRRTYYYLGVMAAMLVFALGAGELMRAFWRLGAQGVYFDAPLDTPWREAAAGSAALAAVGLPLAIILWQRANSLVTTTVAARIELNAVGRKLLEYGGALIGAEATIACIVFLIYQGLRLLLGFEPGDERSYWEGQWVTPLAYLPVAIFLWRTGWRQARGDMEWIGESADAATLRQFHFYLLAAVGLAAFWYGLHGALVALMLVITGVQPASMLGNPVVRDYVSRALALLVVGAPVWWGHWRVQHGFAREQSQEGYWERTLLLRRLYLYIVIAAAVITGAAALVRVALRTPGTPGGAAAPGQWVVELLVASSLALLWGLYHYLVLRGDARMVADDEASGFAETEEEGAEEEPEAEAEPEPVSPPAWVAPAQIDRAAIAPPAQEPAGWIMPGQYDREALDTDQAEPDPEWVEPGSFDRDSLARPAAGAPDPEAPGSPEEQTGTAEVVQPLEEPAAGAPGPAGLAAPAVGAGGAELPASPAAGVAVIDGEDGALGVDLMRALARALPGIALWPIGLNPDAQAAMESALGAAPAVPPDAVEQAAAIVAPGDIVWPGAMDGEVQAALSAAVGRSRGQKVLLPARNPALRWVGTPNWSRAEWIEHAVEEVRRSVGSASQPSES